MVREMGNLVGMKGGKWEYELVWMIGKIQKMIREMGIVEDSDMLAMDALI